MFLINMNYSYPTTKKESISVRNILNTLFAEKVGMAIHFTSYVRHYYCITKTSPYNEHPLTPHFYIAKLGLTGVYIFSYFCSKTLIVGTR